MYKSSLKHEPASNDIIDLQIKHYFWGAFQADRWRYPNQEEDEHTQKSSNPDSNDTSKQNPSAENRTKTKTIT